MINRQVMAMAQGNLAGHKAEEELPIRATATVADPEGEAEVDLAATEEEEGEEITGINLLKPSHLTPKTTTTGLTKGRSHPQDRPGASPAKDPTEIQETAIAMTR